MGTERLRLPAALFATLELAGCLEGPQTPAQIKGEQDREALSQQFDEACTAYGEAMNGLRSLQGSVLQGKVPNRAALDAAAREVETSGGVLDRIVLTRGSIEHAQNLGRQNWRCGEDANDPGHWVSSKTAKDPVGDWIRRMY